MITPLKTPDGKSGREEKGSSTESQTIEAVASTVTTISADGIPEETVVVVETGVVAVKLNQDGFPGAIKNKHYSLESDLMNDLEEYEILDDYKYIALNEKGVVYRTEMPSIFHEVAVGELKAIVLQQCCGQLLVQSNFEMNFPDGTSKYPDLAIWGEERVERPTSSSSSSTTETGSGSLIPQHKTKEVGTTLKASVKIFRVF